MNTVNYIQAIVQAGLDFEIPIKGITERELDEMCLVQKVSHLPKAYKDFMLQCGKGAGLYARDSDFTYPRVCNLKHELERHLVNEGMELPDNAFVFGAYQGYQYRYFICDEHEDPAIFLMMFTDEETSPTLINEKFSQDKLEGIDQYKIAFYHI